MYAVTSRRLLTLVGGLSQSGQGHPSVQGHEPFFPDDGEGSMGGIAVAGNVEGVGQRVYSSAP
jgi:hypothetical protein